VRQLGGHLNFRTNDDQICLGRALRGGGLFMTIAGRKEKGGFESATRFKRTAESCSIKITNILYLLIITPIKANYRERGLIEAQSKTYSTKICLLSVSNISHANKMV
jgi:hypothetical protein